MKKESVMNMTELVENCDINNVEQYRVDKVPMSGTPVDIMDRLLIQNYMK
jgi:hypothetical protein